MNTKVRRAINHITDGLMVLLLPLVMAYSLIGEGFHELAGSAMLLLFIAHHILHWQWFRALTKGKYTPYRVFMTALNNLLLLLMLAQPISGVLMSRYLYKFLHIPGVEGAARAIHLALAYWCYALMCLHLGLHGDAMLRKIKGTVRKILTAVLLLVSCYGAYVFVRRGFPGYMFLTTRFAFFDYSEPRLYFFADYLSIMILFAVIGNFLEKLLKRNTRYKQDPGYHNI